MHKVIFLRIKTFFLLYIILAPIFMSLSVINPAYATVTFPAGRESEFAENSILFYDPNGGQGGNCASSAMSVDASSIAGFIWNWLAQNGFGNNAEAIAGILGNIDVETGGTFDPYIESPSHYFGIFQWGGSRKTQLFSYLSSKGISTTRSTDPVDIEAAVKGELEFAFFGEGDQGFTANINAPTNKSGTAGARAYAELWLVKFERAVSGSGEAIEDPGVAALTSSRYQAANERRTRAEKHFSQFQGTGGGDSSGLCMDGDGSGSVIMVDGYVFPVQSATKSNYLHPRAGYSVLSQLPCSNLTAGCHHDYPAVDLGIDVSMIGMHKYTEAELGYGYSDMYYNSMGAKVVALTSGKIKSYKPYSRAVSGWANRCASITFEADDGITYWIGHTSYDASHQAGDSVSAGQVIGEIGPPQCAIGTQSHVHIDIQSGADRSAIVPLMNKLYESIP